MVRDGWIKVGSGGGEEGEEGGCGKSKVNALSLGQVVGAILEPGGGGTSGVLNRGAFLHLMYQLVLRPVRQKLM